MPCLCYTVHFVCDSPKSHNWPLSFARGRKRQRLYLSFFTARRWPKWRATRTRPLACVHVLSIAAACCKRAKTMNTARPRFGSTPALYPKFFPTHGESESPPNQQCSNVYRDRTEPSEHSYCKKLSGNGLSLHYY